MQEILLIGILIILLFRVARRFIFFNAYQGFQKAAEDFVNRQQQSTRKPEGSVTIQDPKGGSTTARRKDGEYVDFEEIS